MLADRTQTDAGEPSTPATGRDWLELTGDGGGRSLRFPATVAALLLGHRIGRWIGIRAERWISRNEAATG